MVVLNGNSANFTMQLTKGATYVLPIERTSGTALPNFTTLTWTGGIYTLNDSVLVSAFTVTAVDLDNLTVTITAAITATLEVSTDKYGFNIKGISGATTYIPCKGKLIVARADG